jgi:hypothetical protein
MSKFPLAYQESGCGIVSGPTTSPSISRRPPVSTLRAVVPCGKCPGRPEDAVVEAEPTARAGGRPAHKERKRLAVELAAYGSPADRVELT